MDTALSLSGGSFDLPKALWPRPVILNPGYSLELSGEPKITKAGLRPCH